MWSSWGCCEGRRNPVAVVAISMLLQQNLARQAVGGLQSLRLLARRSRPQAREQRWGKWNTGSMTRWSVPQSYFEWGGISIKWNPGHCPTLLCSSPPHTSGHSDSRCSERQSLAKPSIPRALCSWPTSLSSLWLLLWTHLAGSWQSTQSHWLVLRFQTLSEKVIINITKSVVSPIKFESLQPQTSIDFPTFWCIAKQGHVRWKICRLKLVRNLGNDLSQALCRCTRGAQPNGESDPANSICHGKA